YNIASAVEVPIAPAPNNPITFESGLAKYFTPTPGIAPVLHALNRFDDICAIGAPVSASFKVIINIDLGNPFSIFSIFEPYHLQPATLYSPPKYAGIAQNLLSGPFLGIPSCTGSSGKVTT